jgi:Rad3-related DNA helicase
MLPMECNQTSDPLRKLLSLFPYDSIRPAQVAALRVIARMFREDRRFTIIEAPTGAGKSALAIATALYATSFGDERFKPGAYILTPYNNLAMQMADSFRDIELAALRGRTHYMHTASSYDNARAHFLTTSLGVTNYAYFLKSHQLPERQVLILDEGHKIEKLLVDQAGFQITPQICRAAGVEVPLHLCKNQAQIVDWLGLVLLPAIHEQLQHCRQITEQRECMDLAEHIANYLETDDRDQWFAWTEGGSLSAKPLSVATQARNLFTRAKYVVIQSATLFDFTSFQNMLGIPETAFRFSVGCDFPLRNRPIFYKPVGDMAFKTMEKTIPNLCRETERIVRSFGSSKGIIHTHSYRINEQISRYLIARVGCRIITHGQDPREREEAIRHHRTSQDATVLVSPSLTEGVDLAGDLARFQVVCKVPYPRLDAYTRVRAATDRRWYDLKTAWALVQTVGRAVRSDTDFASTFILDSQFGEFACRNSSILPAWWKASIHTSADTLWTPSPTPSSVSKCTSSAVTNRGKSLASKKI